MNKVTELQFSMCIVHMGEETGISVNKGNKVIIKSEYFERFI
jgi:hypothetical protein